MFARSEGPDDLVGMFVMPRRNDDELKSGIAQDRIEIAGEDLDLIVAREVAALRAGAAHDTAQKYRSARFRI